MEQQKVVLITGATSGIGLASAIEFAKQGAKIFAVGRNAERCETARCLILKQAPLAVVLFLLY
ncbi:MAG: SDR family NAD(P)-dependent oxidoreductase, partial [Eubacteriales bacterium]